ncbi:SRPBCC family protein [Nocardioides sp.]|uniref:SRPBCC family protein n=1 Tax=Nocardioides sp. TaxID=35761 RepID=UPI003517D4D2
MSKRAQATARTTLPISPERAWAVLAHHEGMASWGPGMKVSVDDAKAQTPGGVGAVRRIAAPGPAPAIVEEIVAFDAPRVLGYRGLAGVPFADYRGEVRLSPQGSGTRVEWTLSARSRVPLVEQGALAVISRTLLALYSRAARKG